MIRRWIYAIQTAEKYLPTSEERSKFLELEEEERPYAHYIWRTGKPLTYLILMSKLDEFRSIEANFILQLPDGMKISMLEITDLTETDLDEMVEYISEAAEKNARNLGKQIRESIHGTSKSTVSKEESSDEDEIETAKSWRESLLAWSDSEDDLEKLHQKIRELKKWRENKAKLVESRKKEARGDAMQKDRLEKFLKVPETLNHHLPPETDKKEAKKKIRERKNELEEKLEGRFESIERMEETLDDFDAVIDNIRIRAEEIKQKKNI